ncbi:hypothetical protein PIB30_030702 [Stylosanthes scabra]|uniref:F-box domain-containing protein n=1 Tax=Stylosanthes scabra TaxID=79078 RepID=A0ABU6TCQ6_9FABA|nr:hypothetical protein [Stylosanthes scabra]
MSGVDRISELPDDILLHILSFLPSRTVVAATSTLSKSWRDLWHLCDVNSILTCSRLLLLNLIVDRTSTVHLPLLKTLHMDGAVFVKGEYLDIILSASSNIHHLQIKGLDWHPSFIPLATLTFTNLIHMELFVSQFNWFWIVGLLNSSPLLQVLDVQGQEESARALDLPDQHFPQPVLGCLSSHLRACNLRNFDGTAVSIQFVKYILLNARVLNKMTILLQSSILPSISKRIKIAEEVAKLRRTSPTCGVWFER